MRPEDLLDFLRRRPFVPFRIHLTGGQAYELRHPDMMIVLRSRAIVAVPGPRQFSSRVEDVSLLHIARIETLEEGPAAQPT